VFLISAGDRYATASRLITEWRENWGTKRMDTVTIRDWINAGAVIAKLGTIRCLAF